MNKWEITSPDMLRLEKTFNDITNPRGKKEIMISAFRKATKPTLDMAKMNAPLGKTGNLKKSIGLLVARNEVAVILGARKTKGYKGWHGRLVEDGTKDRYYITKSGKRHFTGRMNPMGSYAKYFERAVKSTEKDVLDTVGDEWYKAIEMYHRKNGLK